MEFALVMVSSALGGVARFRLSGRVGETFPWGTMAVNGSGLVTLERVRVLRYGLNGEA